MLRAQAGWSSRDALQLFGWRIGSMSASIALVDDDRNILSSLSIALIAEGFLTRLYSDGNAALSALIDNPPDIVVCSSDLS